MKIPASYALLVALALAPTLTHAQVPGFQDLEGPAKQAEKTPPPRAPGDLGPGDEIFRINRSVFVPGKTPVKLGRSLSLHETLLDAIVEALHLQEEEDETTAAIVRRKDGRYERFVLDPPDVDIGEKKTGGSAITGYYTDIVRPELHSRHLKLVALTRHRYRGHWKEARKDAHDDWDRYESMSEFYGEFDRFPIRYWDLRSSTWRRDRTRIKEIRELLVEDPEAALAHTRHLGSTRYLREALEILIEEFLKRNRYDLARKVLVNPPGRYPWILDLRQKAVEWLLERGRTRDALKLREDSSNGRPVTRPHEQTLLAVIASHALDRGDLSIAETYLRPLERDPFAREGPGREYSQTLEKLVAHHLKSGTPEAGFRYARSEENRRDLVFSIYARRGKDAAEAAIGKSVKRSSEARDLRRQIEVLEATRRARDSNIP